MLNELKELLLKKVNNETGEHFQEEDYKDKYLKLLEENARLQDRNRKLEILLDSSLDELVLNKQRIEALLKQLKDKNGGQ